MKNGIGAYTYKRGVKGHTLHTFEFGIRINLLVVLGWYSPFNQDMHKRV